MTSEARDGRLARLVRRLWCYRFHCWVGYKLTDEERAMVGPGLTGSFSRPGTCWFCKGRDREMPYRSLESHRGEVLNRAALQGLTNKGVNTRIGSAGKLIAPGYSTCLRCDTPWCFVQNHVTEYSKSGGMSPLCELCWQELATPEARLPFYWSLWERWHADGDELAWEQVERAVLAEGVPA